MKFGIIPINIGVQSAEQMTGTAQLAEELGFESAWTFEHVIVPLDYESKYPYNASGKMGAPPETNFVDPLIALTAIAASTKTLRLGTGVNILSQTNPLLMAKQVASIDFLSGGRMMLGAGIGWLQEEFNAMGVPFERRGARFDDYVQAMRKVWSRERIPLVARIQELSRSHSEAATRDHGRGQGKDLRAHSEVRRWLVRPIGEPRRARTAVG
jgi:alkanesulfonate monooxygenase SsuD/methylene tetrahydromethanopterin reductase-like flavin-dependent oxidoreductase (luciferase family)